MPFKASGNYASRCILKHRGGQNTRKMALSRPINALDTAWAFI